MKLIILGSPGAGKGTQARNLSTHYGIPHISTGDLLRNEMQNKTAVGLEIDQMMKNGFLVPDYIVVQLLKKRIARGCENGFIVDGFPRNLTQTLMVDELLGTGKKDDDLTNSGKSTPNSWAVRFLYTFFGFMLGYLISDLIHDTNKFMIDFYILIAAYFIMIALRGIIMKYTRLFSRHKMLGTPIDRVISVDVSDNVIIERMSGRLICPKCGAMYHSHYHPSKNGHACDNCETELITRDDDKEYTVKDRLVIYHELTEPIIDYYDRRNMLTRVDGTLSINEITQRIIASLDDLGLNEIGDND